MINIVILYFLIHFKILIMTYFFWKGGCNFHQQFSSVKEQEEGRDEKRPASCAHATSGTRVGGHTSVPSLRGRAPPDEARHTHATYL